MGSVVRPSEQGAGMTARPAGPNRFRVELTENAGRTESVWVTGPVGRRWAFWNGKVFREEAAPSTMARPRGLHASAAQQVTAPMPATVVKVMVAPGATVSKGDTLLIVEAMKMELPLRAVADGIVATVRCHEGELVQPDTVLVELTTA